MSAVYNTSRNGSDGVYQSVYRAAQDTYQAGDTLSATGAVIGGGSATITREDIVLTALGEVYVVGDVTKTQAANTISAAGFIAGLDARLGELLSVQAQNTLASVGVVFVTGKGLTFAQDDNAVVGVGLRERYATLTKTQVGDSLFGRAQNDGAWVGVGEAVSSWTDVPASSDVWVEV